MTWVVQVSKKNTFAAVVALHEGSEFEKGRARDSNLDTYTPHGRRARTGS